MEVISIILILISLFLFYLAYKIKIDKEEEFKKINAQLDQQKKILKDNQNQILSLTQQKNKLKDEIDRQVENKRVNINSLYENLKKNSVEAFQAYEIALDNAYDKKEKAIKQAMALISGKKEQAENELNQIKNAVHAATAARLLQQQEKDEWRFYSIHLTDNQITDITSLLSMKKDLHDPSIISKIIWSTYYNKPVGDMCNRVLGSQKKCGIYKLTDKSTGCVYIGQSVDIANRWKTHIKYGLGIDTPITPNKLYQTMQGSSLWYWTFELLEECKKQKLNERERFWIDFYQSDKVGLNSTKGNK